MKIQITILLLLLSITTFGQIDKSKKFNSNEYPEQKYSLKIDSFFLKDYTIELIHVKLKDYKDWNSTTFLCRIWLSVFQDEKIIDNLYYPECESLGGCSGIYGENQPVQDYLIFSKFGDYNGQLIIIDTTGKIQIFPGGHYYLSEDSRYVFSVFDSDISGLTIFDLTKDELIFSTTQLEDYLGAFYFSDNSYFVTIEEDVKQIDKTNILCFDLTSKKLNKIIVDNKYIQSSKQIKAYNIFRYPPCNCGHLRK